MNTAKTRNTRRVLAGINFTGLDRIYQQLDSELGMILTFHHVHPHPIPKFAPNAHLTVHPQFLETVIRLLLRRKIDIISLDEACMRIESDEPPGRRFAVFTFDDGYQDTLVHAVPILKKYDLPYTVYLAPGLIEGTADLWWEAIERVVRQQDRLMIQIPGMGMGPTELDCSNLLQKADTFQFLLDYLTNEVSEEDQRQVVRELCWIYKIDVDALMKSEIMNWQQVESLRADPNCTIGAHTLKHRALARLDLAEARDEVISGAAVLEAQTGQRPQHFAYPYGYRKAAGHRDFELLASLGFKTAVTTRGGMIFPSHREHLSALPRISVNGLYQKLRYFSPLISGLPTRLSTGMRRLDVS